jgi:hypothetical protein
MLHSHSLNAFPRLESMTNAPAPGPAPHVVVTIGNLPEKRAAGNTAALRRLVSRVVEADMWDESVYSTRPDGDWILLSRESWEEIKAAVDAVDGWRPWET